MQSVAILYRKYNHGKTKLAKKEISISKQQTQHLCDTSTTNLIHYCIVKLSPYCLAQVHELIPNGARVPVTNQNKFEYLDALAQFRLMSHVREEIDSFLRGLNLLIPDTLLSIFDENELEVNFSYI